MSKTPNLDILLGIDGGESISIRDSRYSHGYMVLLHGAPAFAEDLFDRLTGGDTFWEGAFFSFQNIPWFPLVYGDTVAEAIEKLEEHLTAFNLSDTKSLIRFKMAIEGIERWSRENPNWLRVPEEFKDMDVAINL